MGAFGTHGTPDCIGSPFAAGVAGFGYIQDSPGVGHGRCVCATRIVNLPAIQQGSCRHRGFRGERRRSEAPFLPRRRRLAHDQGPARRPSPNCDAISAGSLAGSYAHTYGGLVALTHRRRGAPAQGPGRHAGLGGRARTIHWHLTNRGHDCPSVSTIRRILTGRGLSNPSRRSARLDDGLVAGRVQAGSNPNFRWLRTIVVVSNGGLDIGCGRVAAPARLSGGRRNENAVSGGRSRRRSWQPGWGGSAICQQGVRRLFEPIHSELSGPG